MSQRRDSEHAERPDAHALGGRPSIEDDDRPTRSDRDALVEAMIESEARYRTIFESEPACVKLVARDGSLLSMNPAGLAMIEADREEEMIGACVYDLVVPRDRAAFIALNERVFEGEHARLEFEIEGCKGTHRQMETFAAPLEDENGRIVAQLAVTHDISDRKLEQAELAAYRERLEALVAERTRELEASREDARRNEQLAALGTLAAGLAHELNNPLGTILIGTEMAALTTDEEERDEALAGIRRDVERCSHIVKSMLRFGRNESSEKRSISMNDVVRRARDDARHQTRGAGVELEVDLDASLPAIDGNATELAQVLLNLIQNATNASSAGGRIEITTRWIADDLRTEVECTVRDHGIGMSKDVLARARDPFFTTRLHAGGTGLGLSVSHGIVADHDGRLTIDSDEGRGTRVTVALPARGAEVARRP
ncbi:MAG: ATP-binding protein [bacterium]|nr:ATP-binding protein [bacterium]